MTKRLLSCVWVTLLLATYCACQDDSSDDPQAETCGGVSCQSDERCCGPAACGFCVPRSARIACAERCPADAGPRPDLGPGGPCGDTTCLPGQRCCGPVACGFCIPEAATGINCHTVCPDS